MNKSRTFWDLTVRAHVEIALYSLSRVYDQQKRSLSLFSLLKTIEENLSLFDEQSFRTRLSGNPFVDSLAETARSPDADRLSKDLHYASPKNPLVKKLIGLRNNLLASRVEDGDARAESCSAIPVGHW